LLTDLLLDGFIALVNGRLPDAMQRLGQALAAPADGEFDTSMSGLEPWLVMYAAAEVLDLNRGRVPLTRMVIRDRAAGGLPSLGNALASLMYLEARVGHLGRADQLAHEAAEVQRAFGTDPEMMNFMTHFEVALRADDPDVALRLSALRDTAATVGLGSAELGCLASLTILHVSRGEYSAALQSGRVVARSRTPLGSVLSLPDLVEAAARSDELDYAGRVFAQLQTRVEAAPTSWGRGLLARSGALLAADDHADALYRNAIGSLHDASMPLDEARAPPLRRMAPTWKTPHRRRRGTRHRPRHVRGHERWCVRATDDDRVERRGLPAPAPGGRDPRRPDDSGATGRGSGNRRIDEPRDRRRNVPQRGNDRLSPTQDLPEARHHIAKTAAHRARHVNARLLAELAS
jgi:hypothetical protein